MGSNFVLLDQTLHLVSNAILQILSFKNKQIKELAERGFDPRTSGLWAQHASTAPLCCCEEVFVLIILIGTDIHQYETIFGELYTDRVVERIVPSV